jgi:hypothetical protein
MDKKTKDNIRKRAKSILHTYINDGDLKRNENPMKYYFRAVKYIMTYG